MIIVAFDPGRVASYARFDTETPWDIEFGEVEQVGTGQKIRPCAVHIGTIVEGCDVAICEEVGAMTGQGVSASFTFGLCLGAILGATQARDMPLEMVTPQAWKSASRLGGLSKEDAKKAARLYAKELWPRHAKLLNKVASHGMAEAGLMLRWYFLKGPGKAMSMDKDAPVCSPAPMQAKKSSAAVAAE